MFEFSIFTISNYIKFVVTLFMIPSFHKFNQVSYSYLNTNPFLSDPSVFELHVTRNKHVANKIHDTSWYGKYPTKFWRTGPSYTRSSNLLTKVGVFTKHKSLVLISNWTITYLYLAKHVSSWLYTWVFVGSWWNA